MKKRKRKRYKTQLRRAKPTGGPTPSAAKKEDWWTEQSINTLNFTYPNCLKFNFIMDNIIRDLKVVWVFIK